MNRFASIGFFLLLLYHLVVPMLGYWAGEWKEAKQLAQHLNVYHSTDDLVEFTFPVPLHQYGQTRVDESPGGEFEYQGRYYNMVRQELRNDTLHLYCYEDLDEASRRADLRDYVAKTFQTDKKNGTSKGFSLKITASDYARRGTGYLIFVYEDRLPFFASFRAAFHAAALLTPPGPPPRPVA